MKRFLKILIKITISVSIIWYLVYRHGFSELFSLDDLKEGWILTALLFSTLSFLLGSLQWNMILRNLDIHLPFKKTLSFYYTGQFFNPFLLGFIGGDVVRVYDIAKTSGKNSEAISTVFLDRLIGLFILTLFAAVAAVYTAGLLESNFLMILIILILVAVCFILVFLYSKPFAKKFESTGKKILPKRFHGRIREIYNSLNYYGSHPRLLGKLFLISIFVQSARILVHYCTARSVGVSVGLEYFFLFIPIIALLITLPISIGGIGIRESSGALLFRYIGVAEPKTVVFELLAFAVQVVCSLPGGVAFIFRKHEIKKE
ncbi:lysylphosphatidylglycerol synthase transmembrane domain-containing protein [candidate division KSB1 bacterium]